MRTVIFSYCVKATILAVSLVEGARAFTIQSKSFDFKGHFISYEEATRTLQSEDNSKIKIVEDASDPIVLLNGFGVGSFHQHRLMPNLISIDEKDDVERTRKVYGIDYLGQGKSWPVDCDDGNSENEKGLIYSIDTWAEQIIEFIETIILPNHGENTKVHLIGNSVGGHLSVVLAAKRPDLIKSICLLNATPVWGLNLKGWSGHLPPPFIPRKIGRYLFDQIRDLGTIEKYLENAYANRGAFDETLMKQIRSCTEGKGGHAAFASIMYSPPAHFTSEVPTSFYKNLSKLKCDVLLLFGKDDPWCTPAFAKRMFQCLQERESSPAHQNFVHRYIELGNVGHCPNHESPTAVGHIAGRWVKAEDRSENTLSLLEEENNVFDEEWGAITAEEKDGKNISLSIMEKLITTFV